MGIEVQGSAAARHEEVLSEGALALVAHLHEELDGTPQGAARAREARQAELDAGGTLEFTGAPEEFTVAPVPAALADRRVEITGPTSRKMVINALNSGARGFMADFEDANSPTWANMIGGQANLADAVRGTMEHEEKGKRYGSTRSTRCCSCARAASTCRSATCARRRAGGRRVHGLRPVRAPQRGRAARARSRPVLLHPEARVAPRGGAVARRLHDRRGERSGSSAARSRRPS